MIKNYGRDVTKFFNGAYKLVNIKNEIQYNHRADARTIANSMVIANLQGQSKVAPVECSVIRSLAVNKCGTSFQLRAVSGFVVENWKHWFADVEMIGRHFLVYSSNRVLVKRQYTICCAIVPELHNQLL